MTKGSRNGETVRRDEGNPDLLVSQSRLPASAITLLTDFGTSDYFVGALKGAILSISPAASISDITHDIAPQDVEAGAFTLLGAYKSFPPYTIHVAVVDPGVGSARRPVLVSAGDHFFIGPDNGIFSYIYEREREPKTFHLTNEKYFRNPVSATFHGRDIFAPVAAALSLGARPADFGPETNDEVRLATLRPVEHESGKLKGRILHIDRFGNCVTNFTREDLAPDVEGRVSLQVNGKKVRSFRRFFTDDAGVSEKLFAVWGSAGFLEIAATNKSAAKMLKAKRGESVILKIR